MGEAQEKETVIDARERKGEIKHEKLEIDSVES